MIQYLIYIILGGFLVIWGANRLTDYAVIIAERLKVPQLVIGLTIVAFGTSMPEFFISFVSALKGTSDIAVGNIIGSNIFNCMAIIGIAALFFPITIMKSTVKKEIPFALLASILLTLLCLDGQISRFDALLFLIAFVEFMIYALRIAKKKHYENNQQTKNTTSSLFKSIIFIILGLIFLILGSNIFVNGATGIARELGVSEAIIGLTIVAIGTSLPELATSVISAAKGHSGIAIGNVLGSNIFNILFILGVTGIVHPMKISEVSIVDMLVMVVSMILLWIFAFTRHLISFKEGIILIIGYCGYIVWLFFHMF